MLLKSVIHHPLAKAWNIFVYVSRLLLVDYCPDSKHFLGNTSHYDNEEINTWTRADRHRVPALLHWTWTFSVPYWQKDNGNDTCLYMQAGFFFYFLFVCFFLSSCHHIFFSPDVKLSIFIWKPVEIYLLLEQPSIGRSSERNLPQRCCKCVR